MSTNYYMKRNLKTEIITAINTDDFELAKQLIDESWIKIAKTSAGWLPLFQAYSGIESVADYQTLCSGGAEIYDEYGDQYTWAEFDAAVLQHEGGVSGVATPRDNSCSCLPEKFRDCDMPELLPVSHMDYANGRYAGYYFTDAAGYEFTWGAFDTIVQ